MENPLAVGHILTNSQPRTPIADSRHLVIVGYTGLTRLKWAYGHGFDHSFCRWPALTFEALQKSPESAAYRNRTNQHKHLQENPRSFRLKRGGCKFGVISLLGIHVLTNLQYFPERVKPNFGSIYHQQAFSLVFLARRPEFLSDIAVAPFAAPIPFQTRGTWGALWPPAVRRGLRPRSK